MKFQSIVHPIVLLSILLFTSCKEGKPETVSDHPNVIVIMTDDQGFGDIAAHGNPIIKTPHLDELYNGSTRFTDFHVNPFCAPTRAALMTGRMSDRTHVRSTVYARNHLNLDETTMAEFFKASGYSTGQFGKWHLGQNYPYRPMDRGFDVWVGHGDGGTGSASDYWGNDRMNDTYYRNGKLEKFEGFGTDIFFDETIDFIDKNKKKPFFVYLATNVPHKPWNVEKEDYEAYKDVDSTQYDDWLAKRDFLATITRFDKNLGKLRQYLKENHLDENTILIFLTDNGTSGGSEIFNDGMRGRKGSMYDGGHRVPLYVHWPKGGLNHGRTVSEFVAHIDLLPTLVNVCNLKSPEKGHLDFDGNDLTSILKGEQNNIADRYLIMHQQNTREIPVKGMNSLVATKQWRLINGKELYNIKTDPGQKSNIAQSYPEVMETLNHKYDEYWDDLRLAQHPYPRPIIGSGNDEETVLVPDAWIRSSEANTWDQSHIVEGVLGSGFWPVEIAEKGTYRFDLRRWPKELNQSINEQSLKPKFSDTYRRGVEVMDYGYGKGVLKAENTISTVFTKAKLEVGEKSLEDEISELGEQVSFDVELDKGPTTIKAWFEDEMEGENGTYYVYVSRVE